MKRLLRIVLWLASVLLCAGPGGLLVLAGVMTLAQSSLSAIVGYQLLGSNPQAESGMYAGLVVGALSLGMICIGGLLTLVPLGVSSINKRLLHSDEKFENRGVGTRNKSGFWGTFAILCAVLACCILASLGGLYLYNTNQSLVSGTATAYALYGPATATAASEMLTQAPGNPAMLAPDCAKIVASIQGLESGDLTAYTSSLSGKWVINWRTRIEFIQSFPFAPVTGAYIVINAMTDDGCGLGIESPEATKADFQANQYIHVSGQIRKINMVSGIPTLEISLTTSRVNP